MNSKGEKNLLRNLSMFLAKKTFLLKKKKKNIVRAIFLKVNFAMISILNTKLEKKSEKITGRCSLQ